MISGFQECHITSLSNGSAPLKSSMIGVGSEASIMHLNTSSRSGA